MTARFYMVWNSRKRAPEVQHPTFESAQTEARRLASIQPGEEFIVLQSCGTMKVREPVTWEAHK